MTTPASTICANNLHNGRSISPRAAFFFPLYFAAYHIMYRLDFFVEVFLHFNAYFLKYKFILKHLIAPVSTLHNKRLQATSNASLNTKPTASKLRPQLFY
eukprot:GEMP01078952.1.p1 GENE.GEMP01078952.1~~GEMP01078952.1.p1  ORF type:complete len:100 (+),score=0.63 GEMP01078952.1:653-952(+)